MKMSIITSFGDRTCGSFLSLSDKDNAVSRTDNFVNVFNSVTSPPVLSYRCVLTYFLTMSVGSVTNVRACELEPRAASQFLRATVFFFCFSFFCVFLNLTLTFCSLNAMVGRRNTSFRFSSVREIPGK